MTGNKTTQTTKQRHPIDRTADKKQTNKRQNRT